jgi:hypothetical protein
MDEDPVHARGLYDKYFSKPLAMLFQEAIVSAVSGRTQVINY